jgi:hypothetical protein
MYDRVDSEKGAGRANKLSKKDKAQVPSASMLIIVM